MDTKFFGLNAYIGKIVKAPGDQSRIVAVAVAMAVSALAHLPSSDVKNVAEFYADQAQPLIAEKISEVGEAVIFASKNALEYAQIFWKMRYTAAFPSFTLVDNVYDIEKLFSLRQTQTIDITSLWSGGATLLSEEMSNFMNRYKKEIMLLASQIALIMAPAPVEEPATPDVPTTGDA